MKLDFGEVLGRTWKIGWNHKALWLFQILPLLFSLFLLPFFFISILTHAGFLPQSYSRIISSEPWIFIFSFTVTLPMLIVGVWSQIATTLGVLKVENGVEKLSFRDLLKESKSYFWRLVGLYITFYVAGMLVEFGFISLGIGASFITFGFGFLCIMPLFLLLALAGFSMLELAQVAMMAENTNVINSISKGWRLFRDNVWAVIILMVILYFGLCAITGAFSLPLMLPIMLAPSYFFQSSADPGTILPVRFLIMFPILMIFMLVIQGILMAFFQTAWAVAYTRLASLKEPVPVIIEANA